MGVAERTLNGPAIEVAEKAVRRRFTVDYKGLYSSHLTTWRAARERGELTGPTAKKRGPVPQGRDPRDKRIADLERETARWRKRAERAEGPMVTDAKSRDAYMC